MSMPAARLTDMHTCPMVTGVVPHVCGPVSGPGMPNVLIGGLPAARNTDLCVCVGPSDAILKTSMTLSIGGFNAAPIRYKNPHGGGIGTGIPPRLIGGRR